MVQQKEVAEKERERAEEDLEMKLEELEVLEVSMKNPSQIECYLTCTLI